MAAPPFPDYAPQPPNGSDHAKELFLSMDAAVKAGDLARVRQCLKDGAWAYLNALPSRCKGRSLPLRVSVKHSHVEIARVLLEHGAIVDVEPYANPLLQGAVQCKNSQRLAMTRLLLDQPGAEPNVGTDSWYGTPLHVLSRMGTRNVDLFQLLVDHGAEVNVLGGNGLCTPLMVAAEALNIKAVRWLLEHGADCSIRDRHGKEVVHYWVQAPAKNKRQAKTKRDIIMLLAENGADLDAVLPGDAQDTPLHVAARLPDSDACEALVLAGADPLLVNAAGQSPADLVPAGNPAVALALRQAAGHERLAVMLVGMRFGAEGGQPNSLTRFASNALYDANVLGVIGDVLTGCGTRFVARGQLEQDQDNAPAAQRPRKQARLN